jgi:tRNA (guanine37-N1)-methyltransferase
MTKLLKSHGSRSISASTKPRSLMEESYLKKDAWIAKVITLFPETFPGVLGSSLVGKALHEGLWGIETIDLRKFGEGRHRNVDDTPYGGGAGMIIRADIVGAALEQASIGTPSNQQEWPIIYLSPKGKLFSQSRALRLAKGAGVTLICGRFEGIDQRLIEHYDIEEVSFGDFILTGGEIAAQALIDATVRLIPTVVGNQMSIVEESFKDGLLEHSHYTKPALWKDLAVPDVLLSGNHAKIKSWRRKEAEKLTKQKRPDLWRAYSEKRNKNPDED